MLGRCPTHPALIEIKAQTGIDRSSLIAALGGNKQSGAQQIGEALIDQRQLLARSRGRWEGAAPSRSGRADLPDRLACGSGWGNLDRLGWKPVKDPVEAADQRRNGFSAAEWAVPAAQDRAHRSGQRFLKITAQRLLPTHPRKVPLRSNNPRGIGRAAARSWISVRDSKQFIEGAKACLAAPKPGHPALRRGRKAWR